MTRFLTAIAVFSFLLMTQSLLPGAASTTASMEAWVGLEAHAIEAASSDLDRVARSPGLAMIGAAPEPFSLLLLVAGLSGLAAAGNRPATQREDQD